MTLVRAEFIVPQKKGVHAFRGMGEKVSAYDIDSAMDTDTDTWTIQLGVDDPGQFVQDMLDRDTEVRVNLYAVGHGGVETLHSGFADEITLDESGIMNIQGRDITAVAVDSQHPPQIWHGIRPEILVAREARQLKIGDKLKLTKARGFKTYATDGSESYWQVWYRFYRKRRMWMWAEADGTLNAMALHYNQPISYYFGEPTTKKGRQPGFIPVEACQWRANKSQRVGQVFYFGHRGDVGFIGTAVDPSTRTWIKRPTVIVSSGDAHNQAEARVEAWEEIFESKVGATEITLTCADPGFTIRQDRMAFVNLPSIGLKGNFYVVGVRQVGNVTDGFYQVVRLREKNYAISRRVPADPTLKGAGSSAGEISAATGIAANLPISAATDIKQFFVNAANKYHGPWDFKLFLGVLLAMCEKESSFHNVREGGSIEYPGTTDGSIPERNAITADARERFGRFQANYANERALGKANRDYGVGYMQLTSLGYKLAADRLSGGPFHDELYGGRWDAESNIMAGAAALADKLGAGVSISADGKISSSKITGLSLQPTEANMWAGVQAYNGSGPAARAYMIDVKNRYINNYKAGVDEAVTAAKAADANAISTGLPGGSSAELRQRVLNDSLITFTRQSQRDDVRRGLIHDSVLIFLLWFTDAGWPVTITALKSDHDQYTTEGRLSAHGYGLAVDLGNYSYLNPKTSEAMAFIAKYQSQLGFSQLIGPDENKVIPHGFYDRSTLDEHKSHIHVGWPIPAR